MTARISISTEVEDIEVTLRGRAHDKSCFAYGFDDANIPVTDDAIMLTAAHDAQPSHATATDISKALTFKASLASGAVCRCVVDNHMVCLYNWICNPNVQCVFIHS